MATVFPSSLSDSYTSYIRKERQKGEQVE